MHKYSGWFMHVSIKVEKYSVALRKNTKFLSDYYDSIVYKVDYYQNYYFKI